MDDDDVLLLKRDGSWWRLRCDSDPGLVGQANDYLGYLADRNCSPQTVRTYGYGLLAFHRWLHHTGLRVGDVLTDDVLGFWTACRQEKIPGRPGPNVVDLAGRPTDQLAPASVNLRLAAVAGMFEFLSMRDPETRSPDPEGQTFIMVFRRGTHRHAGPYPPMASTPIPATAPHPETSTAGVER